MSYSTFVFLIFAVEYLLYVALRGELPEYAAVFGLGSQQGGVQQTATGLGLMGLFAGGSALGSAFGSTGGASVGAGSVGSGIASAAGGAASPFPGY